MKGRDYQHEGRVSIELLKEVLPSNNFEYYLCGNGAFMKSITDGLAAWGVPDKDVYFEAFGPATVKKKTADTTPTQTAFLSKLEVTFSRRGKPCVGAIRGQPPGLRARAERADRFRLLRRQLRLVPRGDQIRELWIINRPMPNPSEASASPVLSVRKAR